MIEYYNYAMISLSNILIFMSNALNLCSMLTTNQLILRILNTIANIFLMVYGILFIDVDQKINFVCWRILFFFIQMYQIKKLYQHKKSL
jgi:hypothetical protein